jgi:chitinase
MTRHLLKVGIVCVLLVAVSLSFAQSIPTWQPWTAYTAGTLVTFNGTTYKCLQSHTSQPGWEPPNVPALWQAVTNACSAVPSVPSGLKASPTAGTSTSLSWSASSVGANCGAPRYTVFENGASIASNLTGTSFAISGLSASTTYSFTVLATDAAGTSAQSAAVTVNGCQAPMIPPVPAGLKASGTTSTSTTLSWSPSNVGSCGPVTYTVLKNGSAVVNNLSSTSFMATGLSPATTYSFTLAASDSAGTSAQSAPLSVTTSPACNSVPGAVSGLTGSATQTSVALNWTAASVAANCAVTGYTVKNVTTGAVSNVTGTSAVLTGLAPTTSYTFSVAANDQAGAGPSASITVKTSSSGGGGSRRLLAGYWHDFDNGTGFIPLRNVPAAYDIIVVAFATPGSGTANITFSVFSAETDAQFISDIAFLHSQGKKVLLSIGGGASPTIALNSSADAQTFVNSVSGLIRKYGFDGIDIDIENHNLFLNSGDNDVTHPTTPVVVNLITALNQLAAQFGPSFMLTIAPETFYVQEGYNYPTTPAYLPVIYGTRNALSYLWVQEYNSGPIMALDNQFYNMGGADFIVATEEMVMSGFPIGRNPADFFPGVPQQKVMLGVPSFVDAGNGFVDNATLERALNYLIKGQSFGGTYVLRNPAGYPNMRGVMTWSINWDVFGGQVFSGGMRSYLNSLPPVQ